MISVGWAPQSAVATAQGSTFQAELAPALCAFGTSAMMVWDVPGDSPVMRSALFDVTTGIWTVAGQPGYQNAQFGSSASPALCPLGSKVLMAWKGSGSNAKHIYYSLFDTRTGYWSPQNVARDVEKTVFGTSAGPALVTYYGRALLVWKGSGDGEGSSDTHMWFSWFDPTSGTWTAQKELSGAGVVFGTSAKPALAALPDRILAAWRGSGDIFIWNASLNPETSQWTKQDIATGVDGVQFSSTAGPALAAVGESVVMTWKGSSEDTEIYQSVLGPQAGTWATQQVAKGSDGRAFTTNAAPALAAVENQLLLTWPRSSDAELYQSRATDLPVPPSEWMTWMMHADAHFASRTLKTITVPGTHDAGMYEETGYAVFAQTQDQDVFQQLAGGVRYFDLRPSYRDNVFYIVHGGIIGPTLDVVLDDVKRFMDIPNTREVAVLKFSHYENFGADNTTYQLFIDKVVAALGPYLFVNATSLRLADIPLSTFTADGRGKVLVVCDGPYPTAVPKSGVFVYRDGVSVCKNDLPRPDPSDGNLIVWDCFSDTADYQRMSTDQLAQFDAYRGACAQPYASTPCDLFLLSWTLTPVTFVEPFAKTANENLDAAFRYKQPNQFGKIANIIFLDYYEGADVLTLCLALNSSQGRACE